MEDQPHKITFEDITSAAFKIKSGIINTPCVVSTCNNILVNYKIKQTSSVNVIKLFQKSRLSDMTGIDLYLKKDFLQVTGSFKERGALYALLKLSEEQKHKGAISASLGNHALALCYHGYKLGIPITVVMPILAPIMKITACRKYGANVIVDGNDMGEAKRIALKQAKEKDLIYINGCLYLHLILSGCNTFHA